MELNAHVWSKLLSVTLPSQTENHISGREEVVLHHVLQFPDLTELSQSGEKTKLSETQVDNDKSVELVKVRKGSEQKVVCYSFY